MCAIYISNDYDRKNFLFVPCPPAPVAYFLNQTKVDYPQSHVTSFRAGVLLILYTCNGETYASVSDKYNRNYVSRIQNGPVLLF